MKKIILFLLFLLTSFTSDAFEENWKTDESLINPIEISNVTVTAVCNTPTSITYTYRIDLCDIYLPANNFHVYISPEPGNTWSYVGNATQVGGNNYLFTVTQNLSASLNPGSWVMTGNYGNIDPALIQPGNGTTYCSSRKLFNMPAPTGNCVAACPWIQTVRLFDNSYINNSGSSQNNYSDYTSNCIPLLEATFPQINITASQASYIAILIDIDGDGIFTTSDYFAATPNPSSGTGFGLSAQVASGLITGGELVRVIVSNTPITLSNNIPTCGEAEDYRICCTALPTTITATVGTIQVDITNTLTATIPCGENCITLSATNITDAVYNSSDPVLTSLTGSFCLPSGSSLSSFTATITGTDSCGNPYYQEVLVTVDQNCCTDVPYIEPFWSHPDCPDVICDADKWPINVLSANGTPITTAGGVSIVWTNTTANPNIVINGDWVYASEDETWQVVITYPDGCIYTATYTEDCCEDDVHIEAIICPTQEQLSLLQSQARASSATMNSSDLKVLDEYIELSKESCDPCDIGYVLIHLVDANGNPIDASQYTIVWSDMGSGTMRQIPVNTNISVTVSSNNEDCIYVDEFFYQCDDNPCLNFTAPTNLQVGGIIGTTLMWDAVPGATHYVVSSPGVGPIRNCRCETPISILPITTTTNSLALSSSLANKCFVWIVTAYCADGTSATSEQACYSAKGKDEFVTVSPNPSNGRFTINTEESIDGVIEIADLYGVVVYKHEFKNQQEFDIFMEDKPIGIYVVKVYTNDKVHTAKIIKN